MTSQTHWLPGIVVLGLGLLGAGVYLLLNRKKAPTAPADETQLDLEKRAQLLIDQLKELASERHHLGEERFAAEKTRLELAAAEALRARDAYVSSGKAAPAAAPVRAPGFFARHPQLTGALWGGGVVMFFVALGLLLSQEQKPRGENGTMTGVTPPGMEASAGGGDAPMGGQGQGDDGEFQAALAEIRSHPENVELAAQVSHELIRRSDFPSATEITNRSLAMDPFNSELRVHRAFLLATTGKIDQARAELTHLANSYPDAAEALLFKGMIDMQTERNAEALEDFERFAGETPPDQLPDGFASGVEALRAEAKKKSSVQ